MFAKYVQKSIFEDTSDTFRDYSDNEQDNDDKKTVLKKRRKKYQDLFEYLHMDSNNGTESAGVYQGLLMRD